MMIRVNQPPRLRPGVWFVVVVSLVLAAWIGLVMPSIGLKSPMGAIVVGAVLSAIVFYLILVVLCVTGNKTALAIYTGLLIFVADASLRQSTSGGFDGQSLVKLAIWGGALLIGIVHLRQASDRFRSTRALLLLFYATLATVSAAWSTTPLYTFGAGFALLSCVLYAAAVVSLLDKIRIIRCVFWGLVVFLLVSNAIVLVVMIGLGVGLDLRYAGLAGSPNNLGRLGALAAIVGFLLLKYTKPSALQSSLGGLIGLLALMASNSRTSLIVFITGVWAALGRRARLWTALVLVVASPLMAAVYYYGVLEKETVAETISRTGRAEDALTLTGRVYIWEYVLRKSTDAPVIGHGYATTRDFMPREWSTKYGWTTTSAHNSVLQSLVTLGLLGTIPLVAIWGLQFLQFLREPSPFRDAMFVVVIVNGFTESGVISGVPSVISLLWAVSVFWNESASPHAAVAKQGPFKAARPAMTGNLPVDVGLSRQRS